MGESDAILKKALLLDAGWVKVRPPAPAVRGMETKLPEEEPEPDAEAEPEEAEVVCDMPYVFFGQWGRLCR